MYADPNTASKESPGRKANTRNRGTVNSRVHRAVVVNVERMAATLPWPMRRAATGKKMNATAPLATRIRRPMVKTAE